MPFIDSKITMPVSADMKEELKSELGKLITTLSKSETYLMVGIDDEPVTCFLIDQRDIKYVLEDFDEVTYEQKKHKLIQIEQPKTKLILPNNKIKA